MFLNGAILGMSRREIGKRFDDIVAFAGLERFIDTPVKNYSSGMYVRLGFSVAINVEPDVLLVDEVLAVGDEQFQRRCAEKFAELRGQGKTIVVVSHALGTLQQMCDEAAWLDHGVLRSIGPTADVVDSYLSSLRVDQADSQDDTRHGSGEIRVDRVELLGRGRPSHDGRAHRRRHHLPVPLPRQAPHPSSGVRHRDLLDGRRDARRARTSRTCTRSPS